MRKPLEGLKMLDLTRVLSGPFCGMVLADLGVETIKIEMPVKGDDARFYPPFINGESAYFMSLNRNKKSMTLDLKSAEGKEIFLKLVEKVDIVLENFRPGTMDRLGLGYDILSQKNPGLIYAACSGYGYTGPYSKRAAYDMIVQAMGGIMSITGYDENHPCRVGTSIGDVVAGLYTAIGILSALNNRNSTREGQMVDVAMLDCQLAILENAIARYFVTGKNPKPIGNHHPAISPFGAYECKDGHIVIAAGNDELFRKLCVALGNNDLASDEMFLSNELRIINLHELIDKINGQTVGKTVKEWIGILNDAGIPCSPINKIGDIVSDPQIIAREMIVEVVNSKGDLLKVPGNPIKLSKTPAKIEEPAPLLGEHGPEILKSFLAFSDQQINKLKEEGII